MTPGEITYVRMYDPYHDEMVPIQTAIQRLMDRRLNLMGTNMRFFSAGLVERLYFSFVCNRFFERTRYHVVYRRRGKTRIFSVRIGSLGLAIDLKADLSWFREIPEEQSSHYHLSVVTG